MLTVRLRRGTPCEVRSIGGRWRPHICAHESSFTFADRKIYNDTPHWVFEAESWQIRVALPMLERVDSDPGKWHVGITGTREGLTAQQRTEVRWHLGQWLIFALDGVPTFHHGGCIGADRDFHQAVRDVYGRVARIIIHPASDQPERLCDWADADELRPPARSLERNRHIVDSITIGSSLIAGPKSRLPEWRSGTWSTIWYAEQKGSGAIFFWPDGGK